MTKLKFASILLIITFSSNLFSQNQNILFKKLTVEDGLSQSNVNCIFQDSKGFIWIGTQDGLNKYNGYEFLVYKNNPKDSTTISGNRIIDIVEDSTGLIWIATHGNGLNAYDRKKDRFIQYKAGENKLNSNSIFGLRVDSKNNLLVMTSGGG